jgi:hypothetical protein
LHGRRAAFILAQAAFSGLDAQSVTMKTVLTAQSVLSGKDANRFDVCVELDFKRIIQGIYGEV